MATLGEVFFDCVDLREILQNSSPLKWLAREFLIRRKTWPPWLGVGARLFTLYGHEEILKKIFSETPSPILTCSRGAHGRHGGGSVFALYGHEEILKKYSFQKPLIRF